jgi:nucleoside-diphosphate-sugar epimerase
LKILITGISGFVGKALNMALSKNHEVFGISNIEFDSTVFKIDLESNSEVENFIIEYKDLKFDVIIHLASKMASLTNQDDEKIIGENATLTKNVLTIAQKFSVKHFIHFSSTSVYPNVNGLFNEESEINPALNPDCLYGLSKWNNEILINYILRNTEIGITHLRCGMIFGEGMNETRILPVFETELKNTNQITVFGNGERIINYIYVDELVKYVELFISKQETGVYNIITHSQNLKMFAQELINRQQAVSAKINLVDKGNRNQFRVDASKLKSFLAQHV